MTTELTTRTTTEMLELCQAVTEISPMPIIGVEDAAHRISYVNPAFCRLVGRGEDELLGMEFGELPIAGPQCALILDRVYRTGEAETLTSRDRSGGYPPVRLRCGPCCRLKVLRQGSYCR
jgi:two-component system NtrC family sensor kinase